LKTALRALRLASTEAAAGAGCGRAGTKTRRAKNAKRESRVKRKAMYLVE
jgi:hypothetical protein